MTDLDLMIQACCAEPDDDTPRLILADAAQEAGMGAWAELIRVQCQLPMERPKSGRAARLRKYESSLLSDEAALRRGVLALKYPRKAGAVIVCEHCDTKQPAQWTCDLSPQTEGPNCYACGREVSGPRVTWHRGLPRVRSPLAELGAEKECWCQPCDIHGPSQSCPFCGGKRTIRVWQPSAFAISAARESGASFEVSDRVPVYGEGTRNEFRWFATDIPIDQQSPTYTLPRLLFESLPHKYARFVRNDLHEYETAEAAHAALGAAVTRLTWRAAFPRMEAKA